MTTSFTALVLRADDRGQVSAGFEPLTLADLPPGEVLVRVTHSAINYKDGLAVTGKGKIARTLPMVAGIDLAGEVEESSHPSWSRGDAVLSTGWGLGEERFGGYARYARIDGTMLNRIPSNWSGETAMSAGTAGLTAMLAVLALEERGIRAGDGPIVVTGAGGGVGGLAVSLLAEGGYEVVASTGRPELHEYLLGLGASRIVGRAELDRDSKPLESDVWAGAVDTVGGRTLATIAAQVRRAGAIAVCGNAGGFQLATTVFPLILRGVALLGIDSNYCPVVRRQGAWNRLARELSVERLASMTTTVRLDEVPERAAEIVAGRVRGRIVVTV